MGNRRDGIKVKMSGFTKIWYHMKPRRSDNEVYINRDIDVTKLVEYYKDKKKDNEKITYYHLFATAVSKIIYNKPLLNRFVINCNLYDRKEVTLSYVAKTQFTDDANELFTVMRVDKDDNLNSISKKIVGDVKKIRNNEGSNTDDFMDKLGVLPNFIVKIVVWFVRFMDDHDLLPNSLTEGSIYHSTVLLSNLGSIHCDGIYHNLTNFGTNSIVVTIGEIKEVGKKYYCNFGITLDERIADGVYFAKCVNLLEYILSDPALLEGRVDDKIDIVTNK